MAGNVEIKGTYFDDNDLVVLVEYWNNTDTTFRRACLTCTATDDQGKLINIGKDYIHSVPGFIDIYEIRIDVRNKTLLYVKCNVKESIN